MNREQAVELTREHVKKHDTVAVDETGSIFCNADLAELKKQAKKDKIKLFIVKGGETKEEKTEE